MTVIRRLENLPEQGSKDFYNLASIFAQPEPDADSPLKRSTDGLLRGKIEKERKRVLLARAKELRRLGTKAVHTGDWWGVGVGSNMSNMGSEMLRRADALEAQANGEFSQWDLNNWFNDPEAIYNTREAEQKADGMKAIWSGLKPIEGSAYQAAGPQATQFQFYNEQERLHIEGLIKKNPKHRNWRELFKQKRSCLTYHHKVSK